MAANGFEALSAALIAGDHEETARLTREAVDAGKPAGRILDDGLLAGMRVVGERFKSREYFLPDVLLAARAMDAGAKLLEPLLAGEARPGRGRVVLGTVRGDLHDIGKNLVAVMLKGSGYDVIDLGKDVRAEVFVDRALEAGARAIGMSALLTTTMPAMREVTELLDRRGLRGRLKTIVGGAPVTPEFARSIGADAYAGDAASAAEAVAALLEAA